LTGDKTVWFESHGIESIPAPDRRSTLFDFARLCWGGANSLATAVLGSFPIVFGLSFWQAVCATVCGVILGALLLAPMALFGPLNGTNNAVSSGAHFGVVGRIVGSFLSLLTAVAFFCISVWSSGDALVAAGHKLGLTESEPMFALAYAVFALAVLIVCIYGYRLMLLVNKFAVIGNSVLFLLGLVVFKSQWNTHFAGQGLAMDRSAFWVAFVSAALVALANPISFGAFLGDWSRYLPRDTGRGALMATTVLAQSATLLPFLFGIVSSSIIAEQAPRYLEQNDYAGGLLAISPAWFAGPLLVLATLSGMSTGTTSLYGTGLDFSSVVPRLSRARSTLLIGGIACALVFVGRFIFTMADAITTFVSLIVVTTTPWMVIMTLGYLFRRGYYLPDALQVFNRQQIGGPYWYVHGWNIPGMTAWISSSILALLTVNIPGHFVGWLGDLAGGLDLSLGVAVIAPAVLYPLLLNIRPDPREVYGPGGPLVGRSSNVPPAPVTSSGRPINTSSDF
jgi:purine-cytosine permease-like protein